MQNVTSPITHSANVRLIEEFSTKIIKSNYRSMNLDVERFFNGLEKIQLYECLDTNYRFYHPLEIIGDEDFYQELSRNRKSYYSKWRWEHSVAFDEIKADDKVLEVGSGFGFFLEKVRAKTNNYLGLELNSFAVETATNKGLNVCKKLLEEHLDNTEERYDIVCSFQVLEHIADVHSFLNSATKILKKGGKLIIGVPFNNPYLFRKDKYHTLNLPPHHAGLWNDQSLKKIENFYHLNFLKCEIEPLKEFEHYLRVQCFPLNDTNTIFFKTINLIFRTLSFPLIKGMFHPLLKKLVNGRNIVAVFEKQ